MAGNLVAGAVRIFWEHISLRSVHSLTVSNDRGRYRIPSGDRFSNARDNCSTAIDFTNPLPYTRTDLEFTSLRAGPLDAEFAGLVRLRRCAWSTSDWRPACASRRAPGIAWTPFSNGRTVLRAGLSASSTITSRWMFIRFSRYPDRTITNYAPDGNPIGGPVDFFNVIGSVTGPTIVSGARSSGWRALSLRAA